MTKIAGLLEPIIPSVQIGTVAPIAPDGRTSAINKVPSAGPWTITSTGILGDHQADLVNHGGAEKAIHHYPLEHALEWTNDLGQHALLGKPGAFGENLSTTGWTEHDVHIGDIIGFGDVLLQVSQGRQPCWKLNLRFGMPDMAYRVQSTGRTGWYYRVLREGTVQPGASLKLIERLHPDWPLARLIRILYRDKLAFDDLKLMAELPELAEGWRKLCRRRLEARTVEDWSSRLGRL
jgi:MOSC domain-containing protein YiiM